MRPRPTRATAAAAVVAQTPLAMTYDRPSRREVAGDPRAIPMPLAIDDAGLAHRVTTAKSSADAWAALSDVPVGPATLARLSAAALDCCTASDAIGQGLVHFGTLPPDAEVPDGWVDRMVELYRAYLAGYWALDDLAYAGAEEGGWTVSTREVLTDDPAGRIAQRARWVAQECPVGKPTLAVDKARRALDIVAAEGDAENARIGGHALIAAVVHHRFTNWQTIRKAAS
jgi:hypothetical protein